MKRFKNILLVDDPMTECHGALQRAETLTRNNKAQLTVLTVLNEIPRDIRVIIGSQTAAEVRREVIRNREDQLEELIAHMRKERMRVSTRVLVGKPFVEIIREALKNEHDLVIIASEGKEGVFREVLFGRTTMHLMRKCPCPVWVIKPTQIAHQYKRILAAVDPDPSDKEKSDLNDKIMEIASSLAHTEKSELHVVHVWGDPDEIVLWSHNLSKDVSGLARDTFNLHKERLDGLLRKHTPDIVGEHIHLKRGDPGRAINGTAKEIGAELIIMGTVCRTGVDGYFIGNTAEKVLNHVDCSVIAIKPDGFISPVSMLSP